MSYLLEFPPSKFPLPEDIRKGPFVIFGIKGLRVTEYLPARIPLKAVLHFVPRLSHFILPESDTPAPSLIEGKPIEGTGPVGPAQYTNFVTIDIHLDIGLASFQRIIFKIMQASGFHVPKGLFTLSPSLITSISIHKTWLLLELPSAGLDALHIHLQALLMNGPPVSLAALEALWNNFPASHVVHSFAAVNYVEAHIALEYSRNEFLDMRHWFTSEPLRHEIFSKVDTKYPDFGKVRVPPPQLAKRGCKNCVNCGHAESSRKTGLRKQQQRQTVAEAVKREKGASRKGSTESLGAERLSKGVPALQLGAALEKLLVERGDDGEGEGGEEKEKGGGKEGLEKVEPKMGDLIHGAK